MAASHQNCSSLHEKGAFRVSFSVGWCETVMMSCCVDWSKCWEIDLGVQVGYLSTISYLIYIYFDVKCDTENFIIAYLFPYRVKFSNWILSRLLFLHNHMDKVHFFPHNRGPLTRRCSLLELNCQNLEFHCLVLPLKWFTYTSLCLFFDFSC